MSNDYEEGKAYARELMAQFDEFETKALPTVVDDWRRRRIGKRLFTLKGRRRVLFAAVIGSFLIAGTGTALTAKDYAFLAGMRVDKVRKHLHRIGVLARHDCGYEADRSVRRPPLRDRLTGQVILSHTTDMHRAAKDIMPGKPAMLISYVFRDHDAREKLRNRPDFSKGFREELARRAADKLSQESRGDRDNLGGVEKMTEELSKIRSVHLRAMFTDWERLLKTMEKGIQELVEHKEEYEDGRRLIPNCKRVAEMLCELREATETDIRNVEKVEGTFMSLLGPVYEIAKTCRDLDEDRLLDVLSQKGDVLHEARTSFMRICVMFYYMSPKASTEFDRYVAPPLGCHSG